MVLICNRLRVLVLWLSCEVKGGSLSENTEGGRYPKIKIEDSEKYSIEQIRDVNSFQAKFALQ